MTILQIFNSRIQKHGSFEDFMLELAHKSKEKNIYMSFVFPRINTPEIKESLEKLNARVCAMNDDWTSFRFSIELAKLILRERPSVIDFHFCSSLNFAFVFCILRIFGFKIIYHYHGEIIPINELKFVNRHFSKLRFITFFVNRIICVSEANKRFLEALNIRKEMRVVYNGIKIESFRNMDSGRDFRKEEGLSNDNPIVTSIGSLIPRKGMDVFIRAAKVVLDKVPKAHFIIIGGGDKDIYERLAEKLQIKEKIIFTGLLKEYPAYILEATDVFVSASFAESFGLSIAEAAMFGIPVVATNVGGVPEVVKDGKTGFLVPAGDSGRLAEQIIRLLSNKDLRQAFGIAGRRWVEERFNLEDRVEELLNDCLN
ncbi:MAG: glycosyltransferase family 4 protein [Candidatus Omnitrophota bacterium]